MRHFLRAPRTGSPTTQGVRPELNGWGRVLQHLTTRLLETSEAIGCQTSDLQRSLLVPLELAVTITPVGPATMCRLVNAMLIDAKTRIEIDDHKSPAEVAPTIEPSAATMATVLTRAQRTPTAALSAFDHPPADSVLAARSDYRGRRARQRRFEGGLAHSGPTWDISSPCLFVELAIGASGGISVRNSPHR